MSMLGDKVLKAVIIDDEPPARSVIKEMLSEDPEIEIIGECGNGIEAIESVKNLVPDLIFLDIQMPEVDGFDVLEALGEDLPAVVFVTAYDQYAVKAFEISAVDYLLKPFDHDRMAQAIKRVKQTVSEKDKDERNSEILSLLKEIKKDEEISRFVIKNNGRVLLVPANEVDWIQAEGNYVILHSKSRSHMLRDTMKRIEQRLDPKAFVRIHRSTIVNIDRVKELQVHFNDKHLVILKDNTELVLSRRYREKLSSMLGTAI